MRLARRLRHQLDEWQQVWRQVEAMVDRLESARDEDDAPRRRTEALLLAAGALERRRALAGTGAVTLSDPVVTVVPTSGWDATTGAPVPVDAWAPDARRGRLPGTDELELAVADLATVTLPAPFTASGPLVKESVRLLAARATLDVELDGTVQPLHVPSYPGGVAPFAVPGEADVAATSLFPPDARFAAATHVDDGAGDPPAFVAAWSALTVARRAQPPAPPAPRTSSRAGAPTPVLTAVTRTLARSLVADVLGGAPVRLPAGSHARVAAQVAAAAHAASAPSPDAQDLRDAATLLEDEGVDATGPGSEELPAALAAAADAAGGSPDALAALAAAADALAGTLAGAALGSPAPAVQVARRDGAARTLDVTLDALPTGGGGLLAVPPELGALGRELDVAVGGRIAYPDGTLRLLRALEVAFARWWPTVVRWMAARTRAGGWLHRALDRATEPFVVSLRALVAGGGTGFGIEGLALAGPAALGATQLTCDAPASLLPVTERVVEVGQVVLTSGVRPGAAVVLGLDRDGDRLAVRTSALRVSRTPTGPSGGAPGLVPAGAVLGVVSTGLTAAELRRGTADDPARDGVLEQAVALHGQLALLLGRGRVEARLGAVRVRDPDGPPLHTVAWHGAVPASTSAFVLHGVPDVWWESVVEERRPTLVRAGELLLLRGDVPPDPAGASGGPWQSAVEVDRAVRLPAAMLGRTDLSRAAVLARDPAVLGTGPGPTLVCGPQEDLVLLTLRRTWQTAALVGPVTFRRDFAGLDLPSLAVGVPLGDTLVTAATGAPPPGPAGVDRSTELAAASGLLDDWTRYAR